MKQDLGRRRAVHMGAQEALPGSSAPHEPGLRVSWLLRVGGGGQEGRTAGEPGWTEDGDRASGAHMCTCSPTPPPRHVSVSSAPRSTPMASSSLLAPIFVKKDN